MRTRIPFYVIIITILLSSCASKPELHLSQDPKTIENKEIEKYWVLVNEHFSFRLPPNRTPPKGSQGYVKIKYLIDSNGNTFNPEIIESNPKRLFNKSGLKTLTKMKYKNSKTNPNSIPVYVITTIIFTG